MLNAGLTIHNWFQLSFKQSTFGFSPEPLEASLHWPFLSLRITSCYYLSFSRRLRCTLAFSGHPEAREQWHCQNYVDTAAGWLLTLQRRRVTDSPRRRLCSDRLGVFCSHHNQSHISPARTHNWSHLLKVVWSIILMDIKTYNFKKNVKNKINTWKNTWKIKNELLSMSNRK